MKISRKKVVEEDIKYLYAHLHNNWWDGAEISVDGGEFEEVDEAGTQIADMLKPFNAPTNKNYKNFVKDDKIFSMKINVDTGEVIGWKKGTILKVYWKIVDEGLYQYLDENDNIIFEYDGYCPSELAIEDSGYGDYIILNIGADGIIENWNPNRVAGEIAQTIENESNDD